MSRSTFYRQILREEFARRCERNPRYSQRGFARALGVNEGAFSQIMAGRQIPSYKVAEKILAKLALAPEHRKQFLDSIAETQKKRKVKRLSPVFRHWVPDAPTRELTLDSFRVIADPLHYAILDCTFLEDFRPEAAWLAKRLGTPLPQIQTALERLFELELLAKDEGGWIKRDAHLITADRQVTSAALKHHQKQVLKRAELALDETPISQRASLSTTMSIDSGKIELAREMIEAFSRSLAEAMNIGPQTEVYSLNISFFPMTAVQKQTSLKEK